MRIYFVLLAMGTALYVSADEGSESGLPEFSGDQLACLEETGVTGRFVIMAAFKNGVAKGVICGDIDTAFICKDARFDLPVSEPGMEGKRNVLMHGLESLEDEGITCGGGFNAMRKGGVN